MHLPPPLKRQIIRRRPLRNLHIRRNMRLSQNLPLRNNNPFLTRIPSKPRIDPRVESILPITPIHRPQRNSVRPGAVFLLACVFADKTGEEAGGDGFEGGDGGGEDADVGFDDGPVHGAADYVG